LAISGANSFFSPGSVKGSRASTSLLTAAAAFFAFYSDFFEGGAGALAASAFCVAFYFFNSFSLAYTFSFIIQLCKLNHLSFKKQMLSDM
jgi:hypothetical protein